MEDLLKDLMEHYNGMVMTLAKRIQDMEENENYQFHEKQELRRKLAESKEKNDAQAKEMEELSRTISVLQKTLKCHNDFIDNGELREDYEKFQDKWTQEEK